MSIDLITGVMTAADPTKLSSARSKLDENRLNEGGNAFGASLKGVRRQPTVSRLHAVNTMDMIADVMASAKPDRLERAVASLGGKNSMQNLHGDERSTKVLNQFESTLLSNFLDSVVPETGDGFYGDDAGADMWRGLQVQTMAEAISERSILGLDRMINSHAENANTQDAGRSSDQGLERKIRPFAFPSKS